MGIYLNPGNELFQEMVNSHMYVDKTRIIAYLNPLIKTNRKYVCISRPRRFGKSVAGNMLAAYYGRDCDSSDIFSRYLVAGSEEYSIHLNKYNVIFINTQRFIGLKKDGEAFSDCISREIIRELNDEYPDVQVSDDDALWVKLSKIYSKTKIPFIFIIDEWDCLFRDTATKADKNIQKDYLDFIRDTLKDQSYVGLAYMTGILPIKKYGEHSALNMFSEFSMTDMRPMEEYAGFTESEVEALCREYDMPISDMKEYYDGYMVGNVHIYNPSSVVQAIESRKISNFWTKTETYEALKSYITYNFDGLKDKVVRMIAGERVKVNTLTFQNDMTSFDVADDILTLLIHLGYLTFSAQTEEAWIPNTEVRQEFVNSITVAGWSGAADAIRESDELLKATIAGNEKLVAEAIEKTHEENVSVIQYNDENSLSCVIALAYYSARARYDIYRELPSGKGFADLTFIPRKGNDYPAMIIELKWDNAAESAIDQINDKSYIEGLKSYMGKVLLVGVNYNKTDKKHECRIEEVEI